MSFHRENIRLLCLLMLLLLDYDAFLGEPDLPRHAPWAAFSSCACFLTRLKACFWHHATLPVIPPAACVLRRRGKKLVTWPSLPCPGPLAPCWQQKVRWSEAMAGILPATACHVTKDTLVLEYLLFSHHLVNLHEKGAQLLINFSVRLNVTQPLHTNRADVCACLMTHCFLSQIQLKTIFWQKIGDGGINVKSTYLVTNGRCFFWSNNSSRA